MAVLVIYFPVRVSVKCFAEFSQIFSCESFSQIFPCEIFSQILLCESFSQIFPCESLSQIYSWAQERRLGAGIAWAQKKRGKWKWNVHRQTLCRKQQQQQFIIKTTTTTTTKDIFLEHFILLYFLACHNIFNNFFLQNWHIANNAIDILFPQPKKPAVS